MAAAIDLPLVLLTLTGSVLSLLGTLFILICYMILPQKRHIRHALIINLTIADFINAANNSTSGFWVLLRNKDLRASTGCTINGVLGQLSIQAVDFSILTITIVTVWIVTSSRSRHDMTLSYILIFCGCSWAVPFITSGIALIKGAYVPASSNWCWIEKEPVYLRYALTHAWRFLIMITVVALCLYIQFFIRRHSKLMSLVDGVESWKEHPDNQDFIYPTELESAPGPSHGQDKLRDDLLPTRCERFRAVFVRPTVDPRNDRMLRPQSKQEYQRSIQRAMLLHAYPIFWIILWIPGIGMRIAQATGHQWHWLELMQASTQFIGLANAITFGWNEKIGEQLKLKLRGAP